MEKAQQWVRVKELFGSALEIESSARSAFLRAACGQDEALRCEVESLLSAHENPDFLSDKAWDEQLTDMRAPRSIGPFELVRKLGEGGMGQVWLAEQTTPVRRQVALKLLRSGIMDATLLQRFQSERQSLAMMDHPAIAKVFEASSTASGQPYLVMEYVPGPPISDYCDDKRLSVRQRLELFIKVCEGVQHAHQKAIIHRDLKPSNILVVEVDGVPQPRIIDFGLAKATASQADDKTMFITQAGGFLGTPGYMSPEQAEGGGQHDIDTRTDVYSLGVVLYVLLTGCLPFETKNKPMQEVLRQLREDDPARPSTRIMRAKQPSSATAEVRGLEPRQLVNILHGDLDWIVLKVLEKDRNRRYGTPAELAAEVRHYLKDEPVTARPASTAYRLQKYMRRHRVAVSVAGGLIILLAAFATVQAVELRRITRERDRADRITAFMSGMFKVSNPSEARGNSITAREILDKASADIDKGLTQDPELQAQMMSVMGSVYSSLGLYARAEELLRRASEIRGPLLGPNHPQTLSSLDGLAWVLARQGHYPQAEKLQRDILASSRRTLGAEHPETIRYMVHLADTLGYQGHYAEAESFYRQALEIRNRTLGAEHAETLASMHSLSTTLDGEGRLGEAEELQRHAVQIRRRSLGSEHPDTLLSVNALAWTLSAEGHYDEAEKLQRESLDIRRRILGPEHPVTLKSASNLAVTETALNRYPEAEVLQRSILEIQRRVLGPENPDTLGSTNTLAWTLDMEQRYAEAESMQRNLLDIERRVLGPENPQTLKTMDNLAGSLQQQGHFAEAEKLERATYEIRRRVLGPENPNTAVTLYNLACVEARAGKPEEALKLLSQAVDHGLAAVQDIGMSKDPDLKSLFGDPRFQALVIHAKEKANLALKTH